MWWSNAGGNFYLHLNVSKQAEKALKCGYPLSSVDSRLAEVLFLEYFTYTGYLYSGLSRGGDTRGNYHGARAKRGPGLMYCI